MMMDGVIIVDSDTVCLVFEKLLRLQYIPGNMNVAVAVQCCSYNNKALGNFSAKNM